MYDNIADHLIAQQKLQVYEKLLDRIALLYDMGDNEGLRNVLEKINNYSRSNRVGNGELSEEEQQKLIDKHFWDLDKLD